MKFSCCQSLDSLMPPTRTITGTAQPIGRTRRHQLAAVLAACASFMPLAAQAAGLVNVNAQGVAVRGYDPVAYFPTA